VANPGAFDPRNNSAARRRDAVARRLHRPAWVRNPHSGHPDAKCFGGNEFVGSLLIAMYSLFQFIGAPILGRLSDERGRRPNILLSLLGRVGAVDRRRGVHRARRRTLSTVGEAGRERGVEDYLNRSQEDT